MANDGARGRPAAIARSEAAYSDYEFETLVEACRALPPAVGNYRITDFVENLLLTVLDFQMHTKAVVRAMEHFVARAKSTAFDLEQLKAPLAQYPDDKVGNNALAQRLWGYNLWTRAAMLRRLAEFFEAEGITDQARLEEWALSAEFHADFEGRVRGLGIAVFNWLMIRQGVDTIKPDVHVLRFFEESLGHRAPEAVVVEMLVRAASEIGIPAHRLDWAIWGAGRLQAAGGISHMQ